MPNRKKRTVYIPLRVRFEIWAMPCAVCGIPFGIKIDHIVAVSKGGSDARKNLQPLCHDCNHYKHNSRSNAQIAQWVRSRGVQHFLFAAFRYDTRHLNPYDGPGFEGWRAHNPERIRFARALHASFVART